MTIKSEFVAKIFHVMIGLTRDKTEMDFLSALKSLLGRSNFLLLWCLIFNLIRVYYF